MRKPLCFSVCNLISLQATMTGYPLYCYDFPFILPVLAISRNLLKAFWLDPFGILPAALATLRLSSQTWIALAALIIGHVAAASRQPHKSHASASYTSACTPSANPLVPSHWFFHLMTQAEPVAKTFPLGCTR